MILSGGEDITYNGEIDPVVIHDNADTIISVGGIDDLFRVTAEFYPKFAEMTHPYLPVFNPERPITLCYDYKFDSINKDDFYSSDFVNFVFIIPINLSETETVEMLRSLEFELTLSNDGIYRYNNIYSVFASGSDSLYMVIGFEETAIREYLSSPSVIQSDSDQAQKTAQYIDRYGDRLVSMYMNNEDIYTNLFSALNILSDPDIVQIYESIMSTFSNYNLYPEMMQFQTYGYTESLSDPFLWIYTAEYENPIDMSQFVVDKVKNDVYFPENPFAYVEFTFELDLFRNLFLTETLLEGLGISSNQVNMFASAFKGSFAGSIYFIQHLEQRSMFDDPQFIGIIGLDDVESAQTIIDLFIPYEIDYAGNYEIFRVAIDSLLVDLCFKIVDDELFIVSDYDLMAEFLDNIAAGNDAFGQSIQTENQDRITSRILLPHSELLKKFIKELGFFNTMHDIPLDLNYIDVWSEMADVATNITIYFEMD